MSKESQKKGDNRLKALSVMAAAGSQALAMSSTMAQLTSDKRGGIISFGIDHVRAAKIASDQAVGVCFIIDVKEWDEFADACGNDHDLVELERERFEWSVRTFPEATPISSLRKLESEIQEIEADIEKGDRVPMEYADALMCLFDSAGRQGIRPEEIVAAFAEKLAINKARTWVKNPDNTYSHVKP